MSKEIKVFIIGLRGYTKNYGGWEAFAHGLLDNWIYEDVHFYAFEKVDTKEEENIEEVNGITCIRIAEAEKGSSAMMKYDKKCTEYACEFVKKNKLENVIMFHLGVRIGPYLWFKRKYINKLGIIMMENPAGAEWRRTKWNVIVQIYLFISAIMMAKSTDCIVCDNEGIRELYKKLLPKNKAMLDYVAYGVDKVERVNEDIPKKAKQFFDKWKLKKDDYYLILGRFVPENNYEMMFKAFIQSKTKKKLLVITNYETELPKFQKHMLESTHYDEDDRVIMAGTIYDKEILHYVRQYASAYIHGHSVGGTNPGLLEAMSETDVNILYNVDFNKYVGDDAALYFSNEKELTELIEKIDYMDKVNKEALGIKSRRRMENKYSWKYIVDEYNRVFHTLIK